MSTEYTVKVDEATVDRVAAILYSMDHGGWISGKGLVPEGTPWGTSRERSYRHGYQMRARAVIEALTGEQP